MLDFMTIDEDVTIMATQLMMYVYNVEILINETVLKFGHYQPVDLSPNQRVTHELMIDVLTSILSKPNWALVHGTMGAWGEVMYTMV
jgi:hypothetical protein